MDAETFLKDFIDLAAPTLDTYESALYLYLVRHSRLLGQSETIVGFKSKRMRLATGIGEAGKPMSERTCYSKLQSLQSKGLIKILDSTRQGRKFQVLLPCEVPSLVRSSEPSLAPLDLETADFFEDPVLRSAILRREEQQCFYCLRSLDSSNYVVEHVVSRPAGSSGYRNVVAACRACNNAKADSLVEDFLRERYRANYLSAEEFESIRSKLERLRDGKLIPVL